MLTTAQLATLKTDILAQPSLSSAVALADWPTVAAFYNADTNPIVNVWKPSVTVQAMNAVVDWTAFGALTVAKQNTYFAMTQGGLVDATSASIRSGFAFVFTAGSATTLALSALAQRTATRFESLFSAANVSTMFGQQLTPSDVQKAMA